MNYILYHGNSDITGKALQEALEINGGKELDTRVNRLIRWGSRKRVRYQSNQVINKVDACDKAGNKSLALELMKNGGVPVPPIVTRFDGELLIGRRDSHMQGSGAFLITSQRDFELARDHLHCTYFLKYIPTEREYRVHIFKGEVLAVSEKRMGDDATSLHIRNFETGWYFKYIDSYDNNMITIAKKAVEVLGLDFGAVDIVKSVNGNYYVLEVNTAPSLVKEREDGTIEHMPAFDKYVRKFREFLEE